MGDYFEFRDDPKRAVVAVGRPIQLCPVKWQAAKEAMELVRDLAKWNPGVGKIARTAALLGQVGLTPDFEPTPVDMTLADAAE